MEPRHHLRCLGQPALFAPNGEPIRFRTKKHLALLVYLAVEGDRTHRRDRLAEFLWPRADLAEARHSLATALSVLRPRLGVHALETSREQVTLHVERLTMDLERLLARDFVGTETTGMLDVASFLEGFDIPDAPEFAIWKDRQQARLLPLVKDALVVLIDRCRRTGDFRQIEQLADRMLVLDELSEEAIRAKMEARALAGDRLTALKVFEEWKGRLREELNAAPSNLIEQMATRMRRGGWERTVINDIPVVPPERGRERAFVGRALEYSLLYDTWVALQQGKAFHSLVLGDSGVGKTTLVARLTAAAALEGASVSRVQAYDLERDIPFATLAGLINGLVERPGASATPPEALADLARAAPEVQRRFPNLPLPTDSQGETARIRLTEAFLHLLRAVAEEHPVILVVDDLHLADEPSLAVLHLALRRASGQPILALLTARPGELGQATQAAILRESLERLGGKEVLLAPLGGRETHELLISLLEADDVKPSDTVQDLLIRASGGFPMVLELLVRDWRFHGSRSIVIALDAMTAEFVGGSDPKATYGQILSRLTNTLEPATKSALDLAAVLGHRLNDLSMYYLVDLTLGETMAALSQLAEVRILRDGNKGLEFTNELIRAHAYSGIPSPVRKALHASIADRLRSAAATDVTGARLEIAWHTMRAGRVKDAIPHLLEGARAAIRYGAPQSAERALSSAVPSLHSDDLLEATFLLVEALQEQGHWRASLEACSTLHPLATDERAQEAIALAAFSRANMGASTSDELFELLPTLKEIMRVCPNQTIRIKAARAAAQAIAPLRDRSLGEEFLQLVGDIPSTPLDPDSQAQLCLARAMFMHEAGRFEDCFREASLALERMRSRGEASTVAVQLQSGLGVTRALQGRYEEAASRYERALQMANMLGNDSLAGAIGANLAITYGRLGRFEDQLRCALETPGPRDGEFALWKDIQLTFSIASVYGMQGRLAHATDAIARLEARLEPKLSPAFVQRWLLWKADALMFAGLKCDALKAAKEAVAGFDLSLQNSAFAGPFARWAAITCCGSDDEREARNVLAALEQSLERYDAIDQLEILCANAHIDRVDAYRFSDRIRKKLQELPGCTGSQLRALGLYMEL